MSSSDDLLLLARAAGGLLVVLGLILLSARIARRSRGGSGGEGLRIVDRVGLSRDAQLAVVAVADRTLLIGITAQGVSLLATLAGHGPAPDQARVTPDPIEDDVSSPAAATTRTAVVGTVAGATGPGRRPVPIPAGVPVGEYPDLASALRAAGRTTNTPGTRAESAIAPGTRAEPVEPAEPAVPDPPRTRAEARALAERAAERAAAQQAALDAAFDAALAAAPEHLRAAAGAAPNAPVPRPRDGARSAGPTRRVVVDGLAGAGSVLSPRTWKQGLDALRELTVRRG